MKPIAIMNPEKINITCSDKPRDTIEILLPDGRVLQGPRNLPVAEYFKALPEWEHPLIVGAVVNSELRELTYPISMDSKARPLTVASSDGARIYRRSLTFLLAAAFVDLFPEGTLNVDHSVFSGGYYCQVSGRPPLTQEEITDLTHHMRKLVKQDLSFERRIVPLTEAIQYFESQGFQDKVQLLKCREKDTLVLYRLGDHQDYHHGYMVPSTGYLRWFGLKRLSAGFILRFPRRHAPEELLPMGNYPMLLKTFQQYGAWLTSLGIESVGALNEAILTDRTREVILISEALHEQKIAQIARQIVDRAKTTRIVLIAGPSSSGKTTFSKRLTVQMLAYGVSPFALEMDSYFIDREKTPKDKEGNYDFEALEALNIGRLETDLKRLINGEEVQLPRYDFKKGISLAGDVVKLDQDQIVILEGIHGLNPRLLPHIPAEHTFRIYISCLTQLNLDRHNRISTTDSRLIRRIVRDARERGYSALETIRRWDSVGRGEKDHIFPYQENADEIFNSALVYELSALRPLAEPLLRQVPYGVDEYIEAKRLLAFLSWFKPIDAELIPDNSILREFVGGSIFTHFKLWKNSHDTLKVV